MVNVQITTDCPVKTDSVFDALFACFDETVDSISGLSHEKVIL